MFSARSPDTIVNPQKRIFLFSLSREFYLRYYRSELRLLQSYVQDQPTSVNKAPGTFRDHFYIPSAPLTFTNSESNNTLKEARGHWMLNERGRLQA